MRKAGGMDHVRGLFERRRCSCGALDEVPKACEFLRAGFGRAPRFEQLGRGVRRKSRRPKLVERTQIHAEALPGPRARRAVRVIDLGRRPILLAIAQAKRTVSDAPSSRTELRVSSMGSGGAVAADRAAVPLVPVLLGCSRSEPPTPSQAEGIPPSQAQLRVGAGRRVSEASSPAAPSSPGAPSSFEPEPDAYLLPAPADAHRPRAVAPEWASEPASAAESERQG